MGPVGLGSVPLSSDAPVQRTVSAGSAVATLFEDSCSVSSLMSVAPATQIRPGAAVIATPSGADAPSPSKQSTAPSNKRTLLRSAHEAPQSDFDECSDDVSPPWP